MRAKLILVACLAVLNLANAQTIEPKPNDACLSKFTPLKAPRPSGLVLHKGDRLAICGDSITEQKKYSRLMEDYLTVCVPELNVTVRQYGWGGETAPGFLKRMTNDCLLFKPTIATTCYGMNDHKYRPYEEGIGRAYCQSSLAIIEAFKTHGVRVIQGSPGCVGKVPAWDKLPNATVENLNLSLCTLRNIGLELAQSEKVGFADVFWPMLTAGTTAQRTIRASYAIAGPDGVHPGWAGHTVMAYAFLNAFGLNGDLGTFTVDLRKNTLKVTSGHQLVEAKPGAFQIRSSRYVFCPCVEAGQGGADYPTCDKDDPSMENSIRSGMKFVPFNQSLNRLMLVVKNTKAPKYRVTWGGLAKTFTAKELAGGINLAEEFPCNPFCAAFAKVDAAVAAKQAFETKQVKEIFHGPKGKADMASAVNETEKERQSLVAAVKEAFVPVTHVVGIEALQ